MVLGVGFSERPPPEESWSQGLQPVQRPIPKQGLAGLRQQSHRGPQEMTINSQYSDKLFYIVQTIHQKLFYLLMCPTHSVITYRYL